MPQQFSEGDESWQLYRALREQWVHEDDVINFRITWLILSETLLFTAYAVLVEDHRTQLVRGLPVFGIILALVVGISIFAAIFAMEDGRQEFDDRNVKSVCRLAPKNLIRRHGMWAASSLPSFFVALWIFVMYSQDNGFREKTNTSHVQRTSTQSTTQRAIT